MVSPETLIQQPNLSNFVAFPSPILWLKIQRLKASKDPKTRLRMVEEVAAGDDAHACETLIETIHDEDSEVRAAIVRALGRLKDARAVKPLIGTLRDRKTEIRCAACDSLRTLGDTSALDAIVTLLEDDDHGVRWHAAGALSALGWKPTNSHEMMLRAVATGQYEQAIISDAEKAVDVLARVLADTTAPRRHAAASSLGKTGDSRAVKPLEKALQDDDSHVRVSAIEALALIGNPQSATLLLNLLKDDNHLVRAAAVDTLGRLGDERVIEHIGGKLLKDESWDVRKLSVEALGKVRSDKATQLLWQALKDADHDIRTTAAQSLGQIPDSRSIAPLVLSLKDENSSVRQAAKASLRQIDRQWEISPGAESVLADLEASVRDKEYWVAQSAADTLAKINDMRQRAKEAETTADPSQQRAEAAIRILVDTLGDDDRDFRQAAAEALGRFNDFRVVTPLVNALDDTDTWVGRAAALALNHLNWEPSAQDMHRAERIKTLMLQT
jgi:HEAT repeat protein